MSDTNYKYKPPTRLPAEVLAKMSQKELGDLIDRDAKDAIEGVRKDKEGFLKAHPKLDFRNKPKGE